jgi:hypothetical protein
MSVLYYVNLEQLYLKDMLAFVVYLKLLLLLLLLLFLSQYFKTLKSVFQARILFYNF